MKTDLKLEAVYGEAKWELSDSDKYVIRVIWNRYRKLYQQQLKGKLKNGEYATRRRNYLNLVYDILGMYSIRQEWMEREPWMMGIENEKICEHCKGTGFENNKI
jgi:hypothetical protein